MYAVVKTVIALSVEVVSSVALIATKRVVVITALSILSLVDVPILCVLKEAHVTQVVRLALTAVVESKRLTSNSCTTQTLQFVP